MKQTANYKLNKPDVTDAVDIAYLNENMDIVDRELHKSLKNDVAVTIAQGGTGANTTANARANLGLGAAAIKEVDTSPTVYSTNLITSGGVKAALDEKASSSHNHTASQITGLPTSLPANGGNADTVDEKHASDFLQMATASKDVSINPINYENGIYTAEGTLSTANGHPVDGGYHITYFVHGSGNSTSGYKVIIGLLNSSGNRMFIKTQAWNSWGSWRELNRADTLTAGTLPTGVVATNAADYLVSRLRNIHMHTTDIGVGSALNSGAIYIMYE